MRLASTQVLAEAVTDTKAELDRAVILWEFVAEQKLLAGLPADIDKPVDADPLQHAAFHGRLERDDRQAQLEVLDALGELRRILAALDRSVRRVRHARMGLGARIPAVDAAITAHQKSPKVGIGPDGRVGTSGVTLEEADRQRKGQVEAETACQACDLGVSVVGRLKKGLCPTDYHAWWRAGQPERQPWIVDRRRQVAETDQAKIVPLHGPGPYRDDFKEVA